MVRKTSNVRSSESELLQLARSSCGRCNWCKYPRKRRLGGPRCANAHSARSQLKDRYSPLVKSICHEFQSGLEGQGDWACYPEDLMNEAVAEFLVRVDKCDPEKCLHDGQFGAYAKSYIRTAVWDARSKKGKAKLSDIQEIDAWQKRPVGKEKLRRKALEIAEQTGEYLGDVESRLREGKTLSRVPIDFTLYEEPVDSFQRTAHEELVGSEKRAAVSTWMSGCSALDQNVLKLKYWDELPNVQIAEKLGITPQAVGQRLARLYANGSRDRALVALAA